MTIDYDDLRAKALAATPGPWVQQPDGWTVRRVVEQADTDTARGWRVAYTHASGPERVEQEVADADYIVAANPAVILALLDELAALRADAERYRWLRQRLYSLDFDYSDNHANVLVFESPGGALGPGLALDAAIDRARTQGGDK